METALIVIIVGTIIAIALVVGAWLTWQKKRSDDLRSQFGPEYDYELSRHERRSDAEAELVARRDRVNELDIRPLTVSEHEDFSWRWSDVQAHFVDDPSGAVMEADVLCREVMQARGYPVGDFEQRAADISVQHPEVVANYRTARRTAVANSENGATTEELREAMKHYRALFGDLLETEEKWTPNEDGAGSPAQGRGAR